jgi:hypothetical protein
MRALFADTEDTQRTEELLPSMSYRALVENLGRLGELGLLEQGSPAAMLVVARLVDRGRILRSGMSAGELRLALESYRSQPGGHTSTAVEHALRQAERTASAVESKEEVQAAAHSAG